MTHDRGTTEPLQQVDEQGSRIPDGLAPRTIPSLLAATAARAEDAVALAAPQRPPLTYGGLRSVVAETAGALAAAGVGPADRVAVVLPNGPEAAVAFLGVVSAAVCAPLNPAYTSAEFDGYLGALDAVALVTAAGMRTPAREVADRRGIRVLELTAAADAGAFRFRNASSSNGAASPEPLPDDVALVLHTSGTTARPKLVPLTHRNLCASAENVVRTLELEPADLCLNVMPLFHIHGLTTVLLASLAAGAGVACTPGFRADRFFAWLEETGASWYTGVPTIHETIAARAPVHTALLARRPLRFVLSSSAPLAPSLFHTLEDVLRTPVLQAYGLTEAHHMTSNPLPPGQRKPGSVGVAGASDVAVVADDGTPLPAGQVGEIIVRGENVFGGYADPEANTDAFVDGWFRTGDEGLLDEEGYLFLRGRSKEIINRGGEKVSPREVDEALLEHADVAEAVAFAVPDASLGEDVAAAVVLRPGAAADPESLQRFVAGRLAHFKVPRRFVIVDEIPTGPTGKTKRIGLAEELGLLDRDTPAASERPAFVAPRTDRERECAELWAEVLEVESVGVHDDFFRLGGDSLAAAAFMTEASRRGWIDDDYPLAALLWAPTVERFAALVERGAVAPTTGSVVPLQPDGNRPPLFLVHHHTGRSLSYVPIARLLGADQPTYGIDARGTDGDGRPHASLEEMAAAYIEDVRAVQSSGPYYLGGDCLGGLIALEMAQQLLRQGEEVALVAAWNPAPGRRSLGLRMAQGLTLWRQRIAHADVRALRRRLRWRLRRRLRSFVRRTSDRAPAAAMSESPSRQDRAEADAARSRMIDALTSVSHAYVPQPYARELTVFTTDKYLTPRSYWRRQAPGVRFARLRTTGLPAEQRVELLADGLRSALADAQQRAGPPT